MKLIRRSEGIRIRDKEVALVISIISLSKFIEGGAAILVADIMNQSRVVAGNKDRSPLEIYILRVCVNS